MGGARVFNRLVIVCQLPTITPTILETPRTIGLRYACQRAQACLHSLGASGYSLIHFACIRRDSFTFYSMVFYGAACYVFAHEWRPRPFGSARELPIGSK